MRRVPPWPTQSELAAPHALQSALQAPSARIALTLAAPDQEPRHVPQARRRPRAQHRPGLALRFAQPDPPRNRHQEDAYGPPAAFAATRCAARAPLCYRLGTHLHCWSCRVARGVASKDQGDGRSPRHGAQDVHQDCRPRVWLVSPATARPLICKLQTHVQTAAHPHQVDPSHRQGVLRAGWRARARPRASERAARCFG